jgi:anti-sigma regulatory factor (Ser/Thr protein kinase)
MGDVVSRGVRAAAAMGEMRIALRAYARDGNSPSSALERLNDLVRSGDEREMATVAYLVLDPASGALAYSVAGHPPPLIVSATGDTRFLDGGRSGPVGVVVGGRFAEAADTLEPGDTVVLYTDGLVERPGEPLDEGLGALRELAAGAADRPDELCDRLVAELGSSADDVAVLVARRAVILSEGLELRFRAVPESLSAMRRSLAGWLALAGADADETYDILLAVGESAANAVEHAYGPVDGHFELTAELRERDVHLSVRDSGRWRPARGDNRGRGLGLMRELMQAVDVESDGSGTVVRMRRRLGGDEKA